MIETLSFQDAAIGFSGAAFAFLFMRLNTWADSLRKSRKEKRNKLAVIEYQLNNLIDDLHNNSDLCKHLAETYRSTTPENPQITFSTPIPLEFDTSRLFGLGNLELTNELVTYERKLHRARIDLKTIIDSHNATLERLMCGDLTPKHYAALCHQNADPCLFCAKYTSQLTSDTIDMLSDIRAATYLLRPALWRSLMNPRRGYSRRFKQVAKKEKKELLNEIQESIRKSDEYNVWIDK